MTSRSFLGALLLPVLLSAGSPCRAQSPATPLPTAAPRVLTIEVVESLGRGQHRRTDFDRITTGFTEAFARKKWPLTLAIERFAANTPDHDLELRIYFEGIGPEAPGDLTFRAWITFYDHGAKHDFGVIRFRYYPRPLEDPEDALDHAVRGAAEETADKMAPLLFPKH